MRRSTTSAGTDRKLLFALLVVELIAGVLLVTGGPLQSAPNHAGPNPTAVPPVAGPAAPTSRPLADGRHAHLLDLGGTRTAELLSRIDGELDSAAAAVTAFWGADWPREIVIAATATDEQFRALAGGGADIAAATVNGRIVFAPGAAGMDDPALRTVLRHELFHHAALPDTAADAPRWLTEGVADFVARPVQHPRLAAETASTVRLPTDRDLDTPGRARSQAYDRAWWFSSYVADRYGAGALRELYLRACGPGHTDVAGAVRSVLGADLDTVQADWQRWLTG